MPLNPVLLLVKLDMGVDVVGLVFPLAVSSFGFVFSSRYLSLTVSDDDL